jgi:hypothetical protein
VVDVLFDTDQDPSTGFPGVSSGASIDENIIGSEFLVLVPRAGDIPRDGAALLRYDGSPGFGFADDIGDLVADDVLTMGQASALLSKLAAAVASLARGNTTAACNQLQALTNQIEAFIRSGKLTAAEGQVLLEEADSFSNLIGC